jgi:hypothetical protein
MRKGSRALSGRQPMAISMNRAARGYAFVLTEIHFYIPKG